MGSHTGYIGSAGNNLGNGVHSLGITLSAGEYPIKVTFHTSTHGSYWTNTNKSKQASGAIYLCATDGGNDVQLDHFTLPKGSSKASTPEYTVSGSGLAGKALAIEIVTDNTFRLRNKCKVTVETTGGNSDSGSGGSGSSDLYRELLPQVSSNGKIKDLARRSTWKVKVKGVDITKKIQKDLISLEITDEEDSEADDLQIKMADREGVWLQKWLNETVQKGAKTKGLTFEVWIGTQNETGKIVKQKGGTFYLDSMKHSGPPAAVTIKCTSLDYAGGIRTEDRDKSWEGYNIKGIAQEIANTGGLKLMYLAKKNYYASRIEQSGETDIAFLIRVCEGAKLSVKVTDKYIVVFDRTTFEKKNVIGTFTFGDGQYLKWDLSTGSGDKTYDYCTVKYTNPKTGQCVIGTYYSQDYYDEEEEEEPQHQLLIVTNKKVESVAEAEALAEAELNLKNKFERTVNLTIPGNPAMIAGMPVTLKKWGYWSGKYIISQVKHTISASGYTTKISLRFVREK